MADEDLSSISGSIYHGPVNIENCFIANFIADGTFKAGDLTSYDTVTGRATILTYANRFLCLGVAALNEATDIDDTIKSRIMTPILIGKGLPVYLRMATNNATAYPGYRFKQSSSDTEKGHIMTATSTDSSFQVHGVLLEKYIQNASTAKIVKVLLDTF